MKTKFLVTGGAAFLGSYGVDELKKGGSSYFCPLVKRL